MDRLVSRILGAARFDAGSYEEVEADSSATVPAILVVIVSSVAAAIGAGALDARAMAGMVMVFTLTWIVWMLLTWFIGTHLLPGRETQADFGQILRTTGFSSSIGILRILGIFAPIRGPVFIVVTIWMLLTFVMAIRQALDYTSTGRAFAVCILGWVIHGLALFGFVRSVV